MPAQQAELLRGATVIIHDGGGRDELGCFVCV